MSDDVGVDAPIVYTPGRNGSPRRGRRECRYHVRRYDSVERLNPSQGKRAFVNGEWSALASTTFAVPSTPWGCLDHGD